ncbi:MULTISPECIES: chromosomal replication initiator protein DnaA [unclassified Streptococcus]|uniref:chromosomal replication initiator protein DnaA n=1 Tax=unclassified Streptococcus TaxID=2608887 RepID=UPI0018AC21A4|nr:MULTISPECIES: chromosomal replication initiator protein DnaA [unclassified Streptococcus]MBF8970784.1 chromosomal replication initiator protein DnaA [Streptococcus sp. NLN76]MBG9367445.1 chromosomal replication initiator protein DnaA [Streptococcus sp. NLN64]
MNKNEAFWQRFLELTRDSKQSEVIQFFVEPAELVSVDDQTVTIYLDNSAKADYWENNIQSNLIVAGFEVFDRELKVEYVFEKPNPTFNSDSPTFRAPIREQSFTDTGLQSRYTFEDFVLGEGNKFAFSASMAVAESPGNTYNPLFLHGGPGLGKTHLINAIGNFYFGVFPGNRVLYISAENFMNNFIDSIRLMTTDEFKKRFRTLDLLIIDDIQALNKESMASTQEELFNTFEALYKEGKQIVFTSDRPHTELKGIADRLTTRFAWGLVCDITPPDYETRIAILKSKTEHSPYRFPTETYEYLANQFDNNVREIEGALNDIKLTAQVEGITEITVEVAAKAIRSRKEDTRRISRVIPIDTIQEVVGKFYGISLKEIKGTSRKQNIVKARSVAMYLSRELTDNSTPKIGKAFGGKDHTTVMHSHNKIKKQIEEDQALQIEISELKKKIK